MIVNRKRPNLHSICWTPKGGTNFTGSEITFHVGANFVPDAVYFDGLEGNPDFEEQVKSGFMVVELPAKKDAKPNQIHKSLAEAVSSLDEKRALEIVACTLDGVDLKEIIRFDRRRDVVNAAGKQLDNRQAVMNSYQPANQTYSETAPINMGEY